MLWRVLTLQKSVCKQQLPSLVIVDKNITLLIIGMGGGTFFKVGGDKCKSKKHRQFLWFELATVTLEASKYDVINCTICRSKLYCFKQKSRHNENVYRWTTWNSNRQWWRSLQVSSVTRAHHTIYTDWIKPFDTRVTEISICSHSAWHYCCSVALVT